MILTTKAIVLDSIPYQDSSLIIRLFTESVGKIYIIVKGAKKRKNNISLITEPGNIISITLNYKSTKNLQVPSEIDLVYSPPEIRNDIKTLHYVMAIISITDKCCHENEKMHSLFSAGRIEIDLPTSEEISTLEKPVKSNLDSAQTTFETD